MSIGFDKSAHNFLHLTHTYGMNTFKKIALPVLTLATCFNFFLFPACKHHTPTTPTGDNLNVSVLPNKEEIPPHTSETPAPAPTVLDIWQTNDIDISHLNLEKKHVAFTFDDAPGKTLERLVAVFTEFNENNPDCKASATVFYNGIYFNENTLPSVQTAYVAGFEMGNHTYSHFNLCALDTQTLQKEIDDTDAILKQIDGKDRHLLRAPYGSLNETVKQTAKSPIIDWSIDTLDWQNPEVETICERVYKGLENGAIVLMHDGFENTVQAVKILLPELKKMGYQVTSVSQLAKVHSCSLKTGSVYTRARNK